MSHAFVPLARLNPSAQLPLFLQPTAAPTVTTDPEIEEMLSVPNCVVAIGVSGGKDSQAAAIATFQHLNSIGHIGPRVLVHADLGRVEWRDSLPVCQRLAAHLGLELIVVRRKAGDMLARWQKRWENNLTRYRDLSCVRLILPWSTPSMRFCTSELKVSVISAELRKRFPQNPIVNVSGIRRQESSARSRMPVSAPDARLQRKHAAGATWNAIIDWKIEEVYQSIERADLALHEAYTKYGSSRVSCVYCIMGSQADLAAAATCADNTEVYQAMVELEADSTFAFQGSHWLADVAPHLLPGELIERVNRAKAAAEQRKAIEAEIPDHLLFSEGWPKAMPSHEEAEMLASVRARVAAVLNIEVSCTTADSVLARYADLIEEKRIKAKHGGAPKRRSA